jgi:hypothetical protein
VFHVLKCPTRFLALLRIPPDTLRKISEVFQKGVKTFLDFFSVKGE